MTVPVQSNPQERVYWSSHLHIKSVDQKMGPFRVIPTLWNELPPEIHTDPNPLTFCKAFKTILLHPPFVQDPEQQSRSFLNPYVLFLNSCLYTVQSLKIREAYKYCKIKSTAQHSNQCKIPKSPRANTSCVDI